MQQTATFLMFVGDVCGKAEEAMSFYTSLFDNSSIQAIEHWSADEMPDAAGQVKVGRFSIGDQRFMASDSPTPHQFGFTPAVSAFVDCSDADDVDRIFNALAEGGQQLMPLGDYGFSPRFGWVADRYGFTWQIGLAV